MRQSVSPQQRSLFPEIEAEQQDRRNNHNANKLVEDDKGFHNWYRFVLSFPPHLVREYLQKFELREGTNILDPFCGTGTTLVEAKLAGLNSIGIEANPIAHFASSVKVDWQVDPEFLLEHANSVATRVLQQLDKKTGALRNLAPSAQPLLIKDSISPLPLHKSLLLLGAIREEASSICCRYELLALAKSLVYSSSNLHFGPEVGVRRKKKTDAPVVQSWLSEIANMSQDLKSSGKSATGASVYNADARELGALLQPNSIDAVFTSPPYPNEKDYTRTTRLESVVLGFINNKSELRELKHGLLRSNTRNVYKADTDDDWVTTNLTIQEIADKIEARRIALGKTSGFEKLYGKVTKLYFGGMTRHLAELRRFLKPGAYLGYVVGDQASYLRVLIRTGQLLADIAKSLGYQVVSIDLFRTRLATATREQLREEVVVLRWPGK